MFFIRFLRWLLGWVRLETEGGFPEKLLNGAAKAGLFFVEQLPSRCPDDHLLLR